MSHKATHWAWEQDLQPMEKLVLVALADNADPGGICWPGQQYVAEKTGLRRETVNRIIKRLIDKGLIVREFRSDDCGRQISNRYRFVFNGCDAGSHPCDAGSHPCDPTSQGGCDAASQGGCDAGSHKPSEDEPSEDEPEKIGTAGAVPVDAGASTPPPGGPSCASRQEKDRTPYAALLAIYHDALPQLRRTKVLTDVRRSLLRARWREHPDLDYWRRFFAYVGESDFLTGRCEPVNGRAPFEADLEWLVRPTNYAKVVEGKYHG